MGEQYSTWDLISDMYNLALTGVELNKVVWYVQGVAMYLKINPKLMLNSYTYVDTIVYQVIFQLNKLIYSNI